MKILAIDSSSKIRSVALCEGSRDDTSSFHVLASIQSASERGGRLASLVDDVLTQANVKRSEIDEIAVGVGPGSAAGIRSTLAFTCGWEVARGIPLTGISSVWAIATQCQAEGIKGEVSILLRGPLGKIYHAVFQISAEAIIEQRPLQVDAQSTLSDRLKPGGRVVGPDQAELLNQISETNRASYEEYECFTVSPMATGVAHLAWQRVSGAIVPAEPLNLVTPEFVKAPPPREIPGL